MGFRRGYKGVKPTGSIVFLQLPRLVGFELFRVEHQHVLKSSRHVIPVVAGFLASRDIIFEHVRELGAG